MRDIGLYRSEIPILVAGFSDRELGMSPPAPQSARRTPMPASGSARPERRGQDATVAPARGAARHHPDATPLTHATEHRRNRPMMICDADFDELFPPYSAPTSRPRCPASTPRLTLAVPRARQATMTGAAAIAATGPLTGLRPSADERLPDPLTDGMMAAMTPATTIGDSLWAGLAAYVEMTRNLRSEQRAL
ncbi:MAG: hypothetical protein M5U35_06990 [Roseovarius sp.]|nr:hypothetical protein [Roseovarius sp.]